jgi:hypothetical protein
MNQEPYISFPALSALRGNRRQFVTTLSLKSLLFLVEPVLSRYDRGGGLRADRLAVKKLTGEWLERGNIETIRPIVLAISGDCRFSPSEIWPQSGAGALDCPMGAVLDVCDGIQRLTAIKHAIKAKPEWLTNQWPVHFIETTDSSDLAAVIEMIREQSKVIHVRIASRKTAPDVKEWTRTVISRSAFLRMAVALDKSTLATRSVHLWAETVVIKAFARIIKSELVEPTPASAEEFANLWDRLAFHVDFLAAYQDRRMKGLRLREKTVIPLGSAFQAMASAVASVLQTDDSAREAVFMRLAEIDWTHAGGWPRTTARSLQTEKWITKVLEACGLQQPSKRK